MLRQEKEFFDYPRMREGWISYNRKNKSSYR